MGPQSTFPAPVLSPVAVHPRREVGELVAETAIDEELLAVTVRPRDPLLYSDFLILARLSAAVQDCTPPTDEHVLEQWAVVYARDKPVRDKQPFNRWLNAGALKAREAAWPPIYNVIKQQWPELSMNVCPYL